MQLGFFSFCTMLLFIFTSSNNVDNFYNIKYNEFMNSCFSLATRLEFMRHFFEEYSVTQEIKRRENPLDIFNKISNYLDYGHFIDLDNQDLVSSRKLFRSLVQWYNHKFEANIFNDVYEHTLDIIKKFDGQISTHNYNMIYEFEAIATKLETSLINFEFDQFIPGLKLQDGDYDTLRAIQVKCQETIEYIGQVFSGIAPGSLLDEFAQNFTKNSDGILFVEHYLKNSNEIFINTLEVIFNIQNAIGESENQNLAVDDLHISDMAVVELEANLNIFYSKLTLNLLMFMVYHNEGFYYEFNRYFTNKLDRVLNGKENLFDYDFIQYFEKVNLIFESSEGGIPDFIDFLEAHSPTNSNSSSIDEQQLIQLLS